MFFLSSKLTLIYTVATTIITFVISLMGALLLNENFRAKKLLLILTILPWALSTYATAVLWRYIYSSQVGLINAALTYVGILSKPIQFLSPEFAIFAVAIAHSWQMAPFGIYFLLASLQVIPPDLYRVARIDRLNMLGRFRHVTFPYIRSALMAMAMLIILAAVRIFDIIYFITNGGPGNASTTLTYYIYMTTFKAFDIGYGSALSTLLLIGILILMIIYFAVLLYQKKEIKR
jgi:ABC-type sugar transport system permease subunit